MFGKKTSSQKPIEKGKLIVIEGTDGSGKNTQVKLLAKTLAQHNFDGAILDFPQYTNASSYMLRKYLQGDYGNLNSKAASILYAIDRFEASGNLHDYLAQGQIVLANRYVTSNACHQGAKISNKEERVKFFRWLDDLEYNIFNVPKPDLTIILHIPTEITLKLLQHRYQETGTKADLHEADASQLNLAEQVYLEISKLFPNTKLIECVEEGRLLSPQEVHIKVWELVRRITLKNHTF